MKGSIVEELRESRSIPVRDAVVRIDLAQLGWEADEEVELRNKSEKQKSIPSVIEAFASGTRSPQSSTS